MGEPERRGDQPLSAVLRSLRAETLLKPDGRYLVYYSWPDEPDDDDGGSPPGPGHGPAPAQQPWTPQAGPADV